MEHISTSQKITIGILTILFVLVLFILYFGSMRSIKTDPLSFPVAQKKQRIDPFSDVTLTAKAAVVWDVKNQRILFEEKPDMVLPLASLTKVMMAVTASELAPSYTAVSIRKEYLEEDGDSGLFVDEQWKLKDLLDFSLTTSSNDGSRAIASVIGTFASGTQDPEMGRKAFIDAMNTQAKKLGLSNTYFTNENGLDADETLGGAYGTAKEVALLFEYALRTHPELMEKTQRGSYSVVSDSNILHVAQNTNSSVDSIPGVVASKTGFTPLAGGNLSVAFDPDLNRPIIIAVLGSTVDGRFTDVEKLIQASRIYINQQP